MFVSRAEVNKVVSVTGVVCESGSKLVVSVTGVCM